MVKTKFLFLIVILFFLAGCDTELGHADHDHDGDGEQDHAAEDHEEHMYEEDHSVPVVPSG